MFGSSRTKRAVLLLDIGSASVTTSIVIQNTQTQALERIWSHTESNLAKKETKLSDIQNTLIAAMSVCGTVGFKELQAYKNTVPITSVQVTISAPWIYTATQSISFEKDTPFEVTKTLLNQLSSSAQKKLQEEASQDQILATLQLQQLHATLIRAQINGYTVVNPEGKEGTALSLTYMQSVAETALLDTIQESVYKLLPRVSDVHQYANIYVLYQVLRMRQPHIGEVCLVQVRGETTEIGIVRDGVLSHVSFIPYGSYTLARSVAALYGVPAQEAYGYLSDAPTLPVIKKDVSTELESIYTSYEEKLTEMLRYTGDTLSIPHTILLDTASGITSFFTQRIQKAIAGVSSGSCVVYPLQKDIESSDMMLSEYFLQSTLGDTK